MNLVDLVFDPAFPTQIVSPSDSRQVADAVGEILLNISTQENPMSGMAEKMLNFGFETVSLFDSKAFCKKLEFCNQPIQS